MYYRLLVYFTSLTVCSRDIKKKSSENRIKRSDTEKKALVIFRGFSPFFSLPLTINLKKNPVNQLIKKSGLNPKM